MYEAVELRDGEGAFLGKGVNKAVENINTVIAPALQGLNPVNQGEIDDLMKELDGTEDKGKLGANAILAVSMAVCKAGAEEKKKGPALPAHRRPGGESAARPPGAGLQHHERG